MTKVAIRYTQYSIPINLVRLTWKLYRFLLIFNVSFSFLGLVPFAIAGFGRPGVYYLAIFIKVAGYVFSLWLNNMLFYKYTYFCKNLGYSYRTVFLFIFSSDLFLFIIFSIATWMIRNFI